MQTEPEQWAVELAEAVESAAWVLDEDFDLTAAALTIQRAFEGRERKLREADNAEIARLKNVRAVAFDKLQILENALKDIASRAHAGLARAAPAKETSNAQ